MALRIGAWLANILATQREITADPVRSIRLFEDSYAVAGALESVGSGNAREPAADDDDAELGGRLAGIDC